MTASKPSPEDGHESTGFDKNAVKFDAVRMRTELATDRVQDALNETDSLEELADRLYRASAELEAIAELSHGQTGGSDDGD
jgi:hypothetical protein